MSLVNPLGIKIKEHKTKALKKLWERLDSDQIIAVMDYKIDLEHGHIYTKEIEK